jgi:hypothetical protein
MHDNFYQVQHDEQPAKTACMQHSFHTRAYTFIQESEPKTRGENETNYIYIYIYIYICRNIQVLNNSDRYGRLTGHTRLKPVNTSQHSGAAVFTRTNPLD